MQESIRYNQSFKQRIVDKRLTDQKAPLPKSQLDNLYSHIDRMDTQVEEYLQVCENLNEFLEQQSKEEAEEAAA